MILARGEAPIDRPASFLLTDYSHNCMGTLGGNLAIMISTHLSLMGLALLSVGLDYSKKHSQSPSAQEGGDATDLQRRMLALKLTKRPDTTGQPEHRNQGVQPLPPPASHLASSRTFTPLRTIHLSFHHLPTPVTRLRCPRSRLGGSRVLCLPPSSSDFGSLVKGLPCESETV